jgi:hypothetical protein
MGGNIKVAVQRVLAYAEGSDDLGLSAVADTRLRGLLEAMIAVDARQRPNITNVLLRLYLL